MISFQFELFFFWEDENNWILKLWFLTTSGAPINPILKIQYLPLSMLILTQKFLILYPLFENSTTRIAILYTCMLASHTMALKGRQIGVAKSKSVTIWWPFKNRVCDLNSAASLISEEFSKNSTTICKILSQVIE